MRPFSREPFTLASVEDANTLLRIANTVFTLKRERIDVVVPALAEAERARWSARLTFLVKVCGCQPGAVAALIAIGVCLFNSPFSSQSFVAAAASSVGLVLAISLIGKMLAIAAARVALRLEIRRLIRIIAVDAMRIARI